MSANQVNQPEFEQLSFKDHYYHKKQEAIRFREDITNILNISVETFYRKLKNNSWSEAEIRTISQHLGIERDILFPHKTA